MRISILGGGSFGTALAKLLESKGNQVTIWDLKLGKTIEECLKGAELVLFAVPAQAFREVLEKANPFMPGNVPIVNVAKGIELGTLLRMSEVADEIRPGKPYVCLSGPSHAEEVAIQLPTTVASCSKDAVLAKAIQDVFMTDWFRVYTQDDLVGVELGGALKNIIALGAGISDGMGFGDNTKAALMTRGLAEITRLGLALGAKSETFLGLAGVGDLIVTCTSKHSRNWQCGNLMGQGITAEEAKAQIGMVVEGASTAFSAEALAEKMGIEMPITKAICRVLRGEIDAKTGLESLMARERKPE